ncbi:MAG: hypothetical protein JST55_13850 [Bacteroidetes bacterium]|nr:hypothetical protein [Bacteroidota bacterium]
MNRVKFILSVLVCIVLLSCSKVQEKVEQKVNEKIDQKIDETLNKIDTAMNKLSLDSLKKLGKDLDSTLDKNVNKIKEKTKTNK